MAEFNRNMDIANSAHQEKLPLAASVHLPEKSQSAALESASQSPALFAADHLPKFSPKSLSGSLSAHQESASSIYHEHGKSYKVQSDFGQRFLMCVLRSYGLEITGKICNTQHLGRYSKTGNPMVCFLYLE